MVYGNTEKGKATMITNVVAGPEKCLKKAGGGENPFLICLGARAFNPWTFLAGLFVTVAGFAFAFGCIQLANEPQSERAEIRAMNLTHVEEQVSFLRLLNEAKPTVCK